MYNAFRFTMMNERTLMQNTQREREKKNRNWTIVHECDSASQICLFFKLSIFNFNFNFQFVQMHKHFRKNSTKLSETICIKKMEKRIRNLCNWAQLNCDARCTLHSAHRLRKWYCKCCEDKRRRNYETLKQKQRLFWHNNPVFEELLLQCNHRTHTHTHTHSHPIWMCSYYWFFSIAFLAWSLAFI